MKLLVVGWDGATKRHLDTYQPEYWSQLEYSGLLPPEEPFFSASYMSSANAWTSMMTGADFSQHRVLGFIYGLHVGHPLEPAVRWAATRSWIPRFPRRVLIGRILGRLATESGSRVQSTDIPYKRVWEFLDTDALVFGLPLTYPIWETNGVMVSGIPAPKPTDASQPLVYPREYEQEIFTEDYTGYYVGVDSPVNNPKTREEVYIEALKDRMESTTNRYLRLYNRMQTLGEPPGFGFLMLRGIDDGLHATDDDQLMRDLYRSVDNQTRRVVNRIDPDAVLLLSDHGMRPTSIFRVDKDLKMDHDTKQGVWGATERFELESQLDVTPEILRFFDEGTSAPVEKDEYNLVEHIDEDAVHERLKDLGYA